jgi:diguanylate cyclase (GGDEF)-like protein/PAS domain S-box-containing protein
MTARLPDDPDLFRTAFETAGTGMALSALDGRIVQVNAALCRVAGRSEGELVGNTLLDITHPDDRWDEEGSLDGVVEGYLAAPQEHCWLRPDGSPVWVEVQASTVRDRDGRPQYLLWQVGDITARRENEERLRHLADHDPLTGLFNRRRFEQELDRQLSHARRYGMRAALLMIDVDRLKAINDSGGHEAGDAVLVEVGRALTGRLRQSDIVARFGGDEFAVLLPHTTGADAALVAQALVELVRVGVAAPVGAVTVSIGVGELESGLTSAAQALSMADASMYRAKARGGDGHDSGSADAIGPT